MLRNKLILILTLSSLSLTAWNCREDYCINCQAHANYSRGCGLCRYRKTTVDGDCSGGIPISKCESYTEWNGLCQVCKEGYYLNTDRKGCTKIGIEDCRWAHVDASGKVICDACDGHYPANDKLSCTSDNVPDTCKYGGLAQNHSVIVGVTSTAASTSSGSTTPATRYCWACKKGYSRSANYSHCIEACYHGCYYCNIDNVCTACDKYNGYYEVWRSIDYGYPKCEHKANLFKTVFGFVGLALLSYLL
jgi:hypothetical protein